MGIFSVLVEVGKTLGASAPFMRVFIPLITVVGVGVLGYFGYRGVAKRETRLLSRRGGGTRVTGVSALILGAIYLVSAAVLTAVLMPFSIGLIVG